MSGFHAPDAKSVDRKLAIYLQPSPKIESDNAKVRKAAEAAVADRKGAWQKVQAVHEWIRKHVKYAGDMDNTQTCMTTLETGRGVCTEMNSLAVAMLPHPRVFPPGWSAFPRIATTRFTSSTAGKGHWISGDASTYDSISPSKAAEGMILQKGDNVNIVDPNTHRRTKGRFLAETVAGPSRSPNAQSRVSGDQSGDQGEREDAGFASGGGERGEVTR